MGKLRVNICLGLKPNTVEIIIIIIIIIFISLKLVTFINEKKKKREGEDLNNTSSCHLDD